MTTTGERQATASVQPTPEGQLEPEPSVVSTPARPATTITQAGFKARPGVPLIEGRRPASWLDDAIAREHEITRRMGLLGPKASRGAAASA